MFWPFGTFALLSQEIAIEISRTAWALTMAAYRVHLPLEQYWIGILKCLFGAFILRCSACAINDILDRDIDGGVGTYALRLIFGDVQQAHATLERTKTRPLASGRISLFSASMFVFIQYLTGICFFYMTTSGVACVPFVASFTEWHANALLGFTWPCSSSFLCKSRNVAVVNT